MEIGIRDSGGGVEPPNLGIIYVTGFGLSSDFRNFGRKVRAKDIQYSRGSAFEAVPKYCSPIKRKVVSRFLFCLAPTNQPCKGKSILKCVSAGSFGRCGGYRVFLHSQITALAQLLD